jgi:hypothetical protein
MSKDNTSQESSLERERRHINREDDPNVDPTDKLPGDKIPGADQTPATARVRPRRHQKREEKQ